MPAIPDEYDSPWKDTLQQFLRPFLELCFPQVAAQLDWTLQPEFLDQELRKIAHDAVAGEQRVDQLIKVCELDGTEQWVLLHVEVQSQPDTDLALRLYQYHYRLRELRKHPLVTLCVLADESVGFRPSAYQWEKWGCTVEFQFLTCKLLDFGMEQLQGQGNPVGLIIAAHRAAQQTRGDQEQRFARRWDLALHLYDLGLERRTAFKLIRILSWLLKMEAPRELEFLKQIMQYERRNHMPYTLIIEDQALERGHERGLEEGLEQGLEQGQAQATRNSIARVLERRFGAEAFLVRTRLEEVSELEQLERLLDVAIDATTLAEFEVQLT